jgi:beta-glucosidase
MNINKQLLLGILAVPGLVACSVENENFQKDEDKKAIWPKIVSQVPKDENVEIKVKELLSKMTLAQKVAQMIQPELRDITVEDMRKYGFGSYLNGGGSFPNGDKHATPQDWIKLAEEMYQASIDDSVDGSIIPTMWGTDAVHGHNNVLGATLFPHNIGLGAANNPDLIQKIAQVTATEVMVTGIDWVFAPTVATVRDDRWGRTYEGYSEDPKIVKAYAGAIVKGLQGSVGNDFLGDDKVISTVKHFIGDGGTVDGDDQGNNISSEQALHDIHGQGYIGGLTAGAQSVMASFNSWQGEKAHGNKYLLTDVLKQQMGFDGFVVGDWNGHGQVKGCSNESCPQAVNSGLDIFMVPTNAWKPLLENTIKQVEQGEISQSRIDDAVTRILRVKVRAGLFEKPSPAKRQLSGKTQLIGSKSHRIVAEQAVRESLVLLKNKDNLLPLSPKMNLLVSGDAAHNIGKQSGGWTITWQGTNNVNNDFPGGSSIYDGLSAQVKAAGGQIELSEDGSFNQKPDVAVIVFGEEPYAEGQGDVEDLAYQKDIKSDLKLLKKLKAQGIPVVSVFISGRPMWINAELNASDAFVAAWLPGSEGKAISDVLLMDKENHIQHDFKGKLSFSWPKTPDQIVNIHDEKYQPLLPYGFGLQYGDKNHLANNLSETFDFTKDQTAGLHIFTGKIVEPWSASLASEKQITAIASNTVALPGIKYRTVDKKVQEDAFRIEFDGSKHAGVEFNHKAKDSESLRSGLITHSRLLLNMKRNSEVIAPVYISLNCDKNTTASADCVMQQDISQKLALIPKGEWYDLSIDTKCFANNESLLSENITALKLSTAAMLDLSISDIRFESNGQLETINCQ